MEKRELIYEGKAKRVYATDKADEVIVSYKDDATALDGLKKGTIEGKGCDKQPHVQLPYDPAREEGAFPPTLSASSVTARR